MVLIYDLQQYSVNEIDARKLNGYAYICKNICSHGGYLMY